ncbi:hypothetical protein AQUCO_00300787v1 [Aquilegia coerulea]|uniref:glutathione transferase n=1 Tax=Aquilegia coerulea TaxID=218851 RepID=A0A2G5F0K3_AQUCA|nr:hypothetical protein AQUCO_00300787v1 [Aquilegia coerulea]
MAGLKLHGCIWSTATLRVVACLNEKGLECNEHKKEPFISLNPFGLVPAFEDGDLKLFESRAITKYIAHEYAEGGTKLIYDEGKGKKMAMVTVWMEAEAHQFDPLGLGTKTKLAKVLDVYEARLSQSKYLAGDEFTLADLHHMPNLHYLVTTPIKQLFESRHHFWAWCINIMARPSWLKVIEMQKKEFSADS